MRKLAFSALLCSLLALVGCKPSANQASAPSTQAAAPSAPAAATPPATNTQKSLASPMLPGLWEITMQSDQMKNMAQPKVSPEQAAQMRKMGITLPEASNGGMVMKVCYTKEMLAEREVPSAPNDQECKPTSMSRNGNSFSGTTVCDGPNMKGTGTVQGTMTATSQQLTSTFKGTMGGQAVNHTSQMSGKYLGADCGTVKPLGMR